MQGAGRPRRYRMRRRLESVEETRRRITASAFELHATIGPTRTTLSAIAERAGVQRHTVYAHFPDIDTLYEACTEHGIRVTAMPEPGPWKAIHDPRLRLQTALLDLFGWYRSNERMLRSVLYDIDPTAPPPTRPDPFDVRMMALFDTLLDDWSVADEFAPTFLAVLGHALQFETWRSLTSGGLVDEAAVELLVSIVNAVVDGSMPDRVGARRPEGRQGGHAGR